MCIAYTTFSYDSLNVAVSVYSGAASGSTVPGGKADLFQSVGTVTAKITNNGTVTGAEVAQLYIGLPSSAPSSPPKQLRGFTKLNLTAGSSQTATFTLRKKDISYWDVGKQNWIVPSGQFTVYVGASSRDVRLTGSFTL
jgi:beta-glucosidase